MYKAQSGIFGDYVKAFSHLVLVGDHISQKAERDFSDDNIVVLVNQARYKLNDYIIEMTTKEGNEVNYRYACAFKHIATAKYVIWELLQKDLDNKNLNSLYALIDDAFVIIAKMWLGIQLTRDCSECLNETNFDTSVIDSKQTKSEAKKPEVKPTEIAEEKPLTYRTPGAMRQKKVASKGVVKKHEEGSDFAIEIQGVIKSAFPKISGLEVDVMGESIEIAWEKPKNHKSIREGVSMKVIDFLFENNISEKYTFNVEEL